MDKKLVSTKFKLNTKAIAIISIVVLLTIFLISLSIIRSNKVTKDTTNENPPTDKSAIFVPIQKPEQGERLRDIPESEVPKKQQFMQQAMADYGFNPSEQVSPEEIAKECVNVGLAKIANNARTSKEFRDDVELIKSQVKEININCYEKYASTDYVEPEKPASHSTNPQTFMPQDHDGMNHSN